MSTRQFGNAVAEVLAEMGEAPEGLLYAGIMVAGASLEQFERIKMFLLREGLASQHPGPVLRATDELKRRYAESGNRKEVVHVLAEDQGRARPGALSTQAEAWKAYDGLGS